MMGGTQKTLWTMGGWLLALSCLAAAANGEPKAVRERDPEQAGGPAKAVPDAAKKLPPGAVMKLGSSRFHHPGGIVAVRFMPGGKQLVTAGFDGALRFWDVSSGEQKQVLGERDNPAVRVRTGRHALEVSRDGKFVAFSMYQDREVRVWNVEKGESAGKFGNNQLGYGVALDADGTRLALGEISGKVTLWDVGEKKSLKSITVEEPMGVISSAFPPVAVAFSADGKSLVTGGLDLSVKVWTGLDKDPEQADLGSHRDYVASVAISADGKRIASYGLDGRVRVWDVAEKKQLHKFEAVEQTRPGVARNQVQAVQISDDGEVVASADYTGVRVWSVESGRSLGHFTPNTGSVAGQALSPLGAISPDGKLAAVASPTGQIEVYDIKSGKRVSAGEGHSGAIMVAAGSADGKLVATGGMDATIRIWDAGTGKQLHVLDEHVGPIGFLQFTDDAKHLISASADVRDKAVSIWDVKTGDEVGTISGPTYTSGSIAVSPDGKYIAISGSDLTIRVREIATKKEVCKVRAPRPALMAFADDGKEVLVVARNARNQGVSCTRISVPDGTEAPAVTSKLAQALPLCISPDGRFAVVSLPDATRRLVDLKSGREMQTIGERGPAQAGRPIIRLGNSVLHAFSADNRLLAGPGPNNSVCVWEVASGAERLRFDGQATGLVSVAFAGHDNRLITAAADNSVLIWDLAYARKDGTDPLKPDAVWNALAGDDAGKAYAAMLQLHSTPKEAAELIAERLKHAEIAGEKQILQYITDLDSEDFNVRKTATAELQKLGEAAEPYLKKALDEKPPLEVKQRLEELLNRIEASALSADEIRGHRCIEVLEKLATPEARQALEKFANGPKGDKVARWATEALGRIGE